MAPLSADLARADVVTVRWRAEGQVGTGVAPYGRRGRPGAPVEGGADDDHDARGDEDEGDAPGGIGRAGTDDGQGSQRGQSARERGVDLPARTDSADPYRLR
ncbi:hypothetical protein ACIBRY_18330 [Streptomyces anulatus]